MPREHNCPKCDEETIYYETDGDDNGLPGTYYRSFILAMIVGQDCECKFTDEELEKLEDEISDKETEWMYESDYD